MRKLIPLLALSAWAAAAQAHFIWIEQDDSGPARAYFGEWQHDERELTGGSLDKVKAAGIVGVPAKSVQRRTDHIEFPRAEGAARLTEAFAPRENKREGTRVRTLFHARAGLQATDARLDLELVPVAPGSTELVLMFRGAPLPKASLTVYGPPKWEKPLKTDEQGRVSIPTPWAGRYVVYAAHTLAQPGEADGQPYDQTRHVATLTFVAAQP